MSIVNTLTSPATTLALLTSATLLCGSAKWSEGSTTIWNTNLNFQEFAGQPGGFEAGTAILQNGAQPGPVERGYDVLHQTGTDLATGMAVYGEGQDGVAGLFLRGPLVGKRSRGGDPPRRG